MKKQRGARLKARTYFEQIPVEVVKRLVASEGSKKETAAPRNARPRKAALAKAV